MLFGSFVSFLFFVVLSHPLSACSLFIVSSFRMDLAGFADWLTSRQNRWYFSCLFFSLSLSTIISVVCKLLFCHFHFSLLFLVAMWSNNVFSVHSMNLSFYRSDVVFFLLAATQNQQSTVTIFHFLMPTTDKRN